jgi:tetratricopeptide (TPR) repeat protein
MWIQLLAGMMTVIWIIIQFAAWRRLNEARVERYLEDRIDSEREDLARERQETLARLDGVIRRRGFKRIVLLAWAHVVLTISFLLRVLSLDTVKGLSNHSELLLQVGRARRARRIYLDIANERMSKLRLYEEALANTRLDAQNALIFAGRIAVIEHRPAAAVAAFRRVIRLQDDADARLLVAQQLMPTDPDGALQQLQTALAMPEATGRPQTRSEIYRCIAQIRMEQREFGRARQALRRALDIDRPLRYYAGIARTQEMRGDLYAAHRRFHNAAISAYGDAVANFNLVPDPRRERAVQQKLDALRGNVTGPVDDWWTRWLERRGRTFLTRAEQRRARVNRTTP